MSLSSQNINNITTLNINSDNNTFQVLKETLYPGSTDEEVSMILNYCKARKIDPILKPVHLVPISVKTNKKDMDGKFIYERKNVIMPGIGLYRIDASRSGQYAGVTEAEFGEEVTREFGDKIKRRITFPKWCKVTVKKIISDGSIAEFTAKEFWLENYASKSKFDDSPNDIWEKRAYGQLAKCTEAQALRKAFPDVIGNEYTKEEMEGKLLFDEHQYKTNKSIKNIPGTVLLKNEPIKEEASKRDLEQDLLDISQCNTIDELQNMFTIAYKHYVSIKDKESLNRLIQAKDKKKELIDKNNALLKEFNDEIDSVTGEVLNHESN